MRVVPAKNGMLWLVQGLKLIFRRPLAWLGMFFSIFLAVSILGSIPAAGGFLMTASFPFCILLVVWFSEVISGAGKQDAARLAQLVRARVKLLLLLSVSYYLLVVIAFGLTALADGGALFFAFVGKNGLDPKIFQSPDGQLAGMIAMLAITPVGMAYWFAPMLVAWNDMTPFKALFFSFFASFRNWRAGTVYSLGLIVLALAGSVLATFLVAALARDPKPAAMMLFASVGLMSMILSFVVFASIQPSYADVFAEMRPIAPPPTPPESTQKP